VTDRKTVEEQRRILQEQLFHSQKFESLSRLAGGMAHDFNNTLAEIQGALSILEYKLGGRSKYRKDLSKMKSVVTKGAERTKELLAFSRRGKLEIKSIDLNSVIEESFKMFVRLHPKVSVKLELTSDATTIMADRMQIEDMFRNFLLNAARSMPDGGQLFIHTEKEELSVNEVLPYGCLPGAYLKISIQDSGAGIDSKNLTHLFEPFLESAEIDRARGLAFASIYGIVKAHEGFVTVASELGLGSQFQVYLPLHRRTKIERNLLSP
jgi:two-component system, cell cycle sensor histidine kinase and response regulator CckA